MSPQPTLPFTVVFNYTCNMSSINSNVSSVLFVVPNTVTLHVGILNYQSQFVVKAGGVAEVQRKIKRKRSKRKEKKKKLRQKEA
jgi:hypothetical protein